MLGSLVVWFEWVSLVGCRFDVLVLFAGLCCLGSLVCFVVYLVFDYVGGSAAGCWLLILFVLTFGVMFIVVVWLLVCFVHTVGCCRLDCILLVWWLAFDVDFNGMYLVVNSVEHVRRVHLLLLFALRCFKGAWFTLVVVWFCLLFAFVVV